MNLNATVNLNGPVSSIEKHYASGYESERLRQGTGPLEQARTEDLLLRALPAAPATVLDVGGGPGVYSAFLAGSGYALNLVDIVPVHVEQARATFRERQLAAATAQLADARDLPFPDASFDAVLVMGPLYHLTGRSDRIRALSEARRVARPGARIVATLISRYASLLDGMSRLLVKDQRFVNLMEEDLRSGHHENVTERPDYFTTAYFHHPDEVRAEFEEAGLSNVALCAIEGPFWLLPSFPALWDDPALRAQMLQQLRAIEREPSMLGASAHLFVQADVPGPVR